MYEHSLKSSKCSLQRCVVKSSLEDICVSCCPFWFGEDRLHGCASIFYKLVAWLSCCLCVVCLQEMCFLLKAKEALGSFWSCMGSKGSKQLAIRFCGCCLGESTHRRCAVLLKDEEEFLIDLGKVFFLPSLYQTEGVRDDSLVLPEFSKKHCLASEHLVIVFVWGCWYVGPS